MGLITNSADVKNYNVIAQIFIKALVRLAVLMIGMLMTN